MAKIIANIQRIQTAMQNGTLAPSLGLVLKKNAIAGIANGVASKEARRYMSMFADNDEQLNLLTSIQPPANKPWLPEAQAYMMANAVCNPNTNGATGNGIFGTPMADQLDEGVSSTEQAGFKDQRPDDFKAVLP
jgi:hypothetical protein